MNYECLIYDKLLSTNGLLVKVTQQYIYFLQCSSSLESSKILLFSTKGSIEVISVGMERSNGIPMEIFRLSRNVRKDFFLSSFFDFLKIISPKFCI